MVLKVECKLKQLEHFNVLRVMNKEIVEQVHYNKLNFQKKNTFNV